jgi:hypothetical protein
VWSEFAVSFRVVEIVMPLVWLIKSSVEVVKIDGLVTCTLPTELLLCHTTLPL